jgi:tetratricopeptide (TPR) repeat protein
LGDKEDTTAKEAPAAKGASSKGWGEIWQLPALALALMLLTGGLAAAMLTAPKSDYAMMLDRAESLLERDEHTAALEVLNTKIYPHTDKGDFKKDHRARFHLLRARGLYYGQVAMGISRSDNNANIISEYLKAKELGAATNPRDEFAIGDTYIALGDNERAMDRMDLLMHQDPDLRNELVRRMVRANLAKPIPDVQATLELLADYVTVNVALTPDDHAWAEARTAELLIKAGQTQDAINKLLRAMPRTHKASNAVRGELFLLLGKAYVIEADVRGASDQLDRAMELLSPQSVMFGQAAVLRAGVDVLAAKPASARERYEAVLRSFSDPEVMLPALLGLGEVEASQFDDEAALATYKQLVDLMPGLIDDTELSAGQISQSLLQWYEQRTDGAKLREARRYAQLAEEAHGDMESSPAQVLLANAYASRRVARELLDEAGVSDETPWSITKVDAATREQARRLLIEAGRYFREHASRVVQTDNRAYGESLWLAGDSYDAAGHLPEAIRAFGEYANGFVNDPRQAEARFRLAQSYRALKDYSTAADFYEGLISDRANPRGNKGVGLFAAKSFVPLAQAYLNDEDEGNDDRAEQLLERVIGGELGTPEIPEYREAVFAMGRLQFSRGKFARSIEFLEEAYSLSEDPIEHVRIQFRLADAYRQAAHAVEGVLAQALSVQERQHLTQERRERLTTALGLFEQVRDALTLREASLSDLDRRYLRDSRFYLGDCAFDLGDYRQAITFYEAAKNRHPTDPASLVALIQIVNAYRMLEEYTSARIANERAINFFDALPPEVWDDKTLPMGRADWERWLDSSYTLSRMQDDG